MVLGISLFFMNRKASRCCKYRPYHSCVFRFILYFSNSQVFQNNPTFIIRYIRVSTDLSFVQAMDFSEDNRYLVCALGDSKQIAIYRLSKEGGSLYKQFPIGIFPHFLSFLNS